MCLACEMDAWWFAEMEEPARAAPGTAGVPPASSVCSKKAGGTPAVPDAFTAPSA
jgi:hypothetical protein